MGPLCKDGSVARSDILHASILVPGFVLPASQMKPSSFSLLCITETKD